MSNPTVEDKLVELITALQSGAVEVKGQVIKYGPDIGDTALAVVRVNGGQEVMTAATLIVVSSALVLALRWWWRVTKDWEDHDRTPARTSAGVGVGAAVFGMSLHVILTLANIWTWVQIFEPKLYLAKQIIDSVLKATK